MNYANYYRPNTRPRSKPKATYQNPSGSSYTPGMNYTGQNQLLNRPGIQYQSYTPQQQNPYQQYGYGYQPRRLEATEEMRERGVGMRRQRPQGPYQPGFMGGGGGYDGRPGWKPPGQSSGYQPPMSNFGSSPGYSLYQPQGYGYQPRQMMSNF